MAERDVDERCEQTDLIRAQCHHCDPRPGAVDLHRPGGSSSASGYAQEVVATVYVDGLAYGLVPSGGTAYVFGSGHGLHHRAECSEGSDTPSERVLAYPDTNGDLWRTVMPTPGPESGAATPVNVNGRAVTTCCGVCALRPLSR